MHQRGLSKSDQLGMAQWISVRFSAISSMTNAAALFIKNDCCHWNFTVATRFSCALHQHLHPAPPELFVHSPSHLVLVNHP